MEPQHAKMAADGQKTNLICIKDMELPQNTQSHASPMLTCMSTAHAGLRKTQIPSEQVWELPEILPL